MAYNGNGKSSPTGFSRVSEWKLKEQMCDIGHRIWLKGFCAGNEGNHSYRIGDNRVLCTPTGISKGQLKPDDICLVDMEGKQVAGSRKRTSEIMMHLEIYKARPDVRCVIHSHPPHATAFAVAGVDLPTCVHPEAEVFLGAVSMAKYVTPGDQRLGESLLPYVKDSNTVLLQNHGIVTWGESLEQTYYQLEIVDAYARILILAKQVGAIKPLEPDQMRELLDLKSRFGLKDARVDAGLEKLSCQGDFISRVAAADIATKGRMATDTGTVPAPQTAAADGTSSTLERAISALAPQQYTEAEVEARVQTITDQIMEAVA